MELLDLIPQKFTPQNDVRLSYSEGGKKSQVRDVMKSKGEFLDLSPKNRPHKDKRSGGKFRG